MPAKSKAQQRLFGAAEHGATFPLAKKLRGSMTHQQLHDFAATKTQKLPSHVSIRAHAATVGQSMPTGRRGWPHGNLGAFLHPKRAR